MNTQGIEVATTFLSSLATILTVLLPILIGVFFYGIWKNYFYKKINRTQFKETHADSSLQKKLDVLNKQWSSKIEDYNKKVQKTVTINRITKKETSKLENIKNNSIAVLNEMFVKDSKFSVYSIIILITAIIFTILFNIAHNGLTPAIYFTIIEIVIWLQILAVKLGNTKVKELELAEDFMNLNIAVYLNANSFDISIQRMYSTINRKSKLRKPLKKFLENINVLGRPLESSVDLLKKDLNYVPELITYLDNVKTIEKTNGDMKQSLSGLVVGLQNKIALNKDYFGSTIFSTASYIVIFLTLLPYSLVLQTINESITMSTTTIIIQNFLLICYIILGLIMLNNIVARIEFYSNPEENEGDEI